MPPIRSPSEEERELREINFALTNDGVDCVDSVLMEVMAPRSRPEGVQLVMSG